MAAIEQLRAEILAHIAEVATWGCHPASGRHAASYARHHAALARTSRRLHSILNPLLYRRNLTCDAPLDSCMLWAAQKGRLGTIKRARSFGASLDCNGTRYPGDLTDGWDGIPGRLRFMASPLHLAIQNNDVEMVDYLLVNGASVDVPSRSLCHCSRNMNYPLHTALFHNSDIEHCLARKLVEHGAYLEAPGVPAVDAIASKAPRLLQFMLERPESDSLAASISYAVKQRNLELVQSLLARPGTDLAVIPDRGQIPLHLAVTRATEDAAIVRLLLARPDVDVSVRDESENTALHHAARLGRLDIVELLLQHPGIGLSTKNDDGITPLRMAAGAGAKLIFDLLLQHQPEQMGAPTSIESAKVLHAVCGARESDESLQLVKSLLEPGVPVDAELDLRTPIYCALKSHNLRVARHLLDDGANPLIAYGGQPGPILHLCLEKPHPLQTELVRDLLAHGVPADEDSNLMDEHRGDLGQFASDASPYFYAAAGARNLECMKMLLEDGADPDGWVTCKWSDVDEIEQGEEQGFISALIRHYWAREIPSKEEINQAADLIRFMIQNGACIGEKGYGPNGLEYACDLASEHGENALLKLMLELATGENIDAEHVQELIDDREDSEATWRNVERTKDVVKALVELKERLPEDDGEGDDCEQDESDDEEGTDEEDDGV